MYVKTGGLRRWSSCALIAAFMGAVAPVRAEPHEPRLATADAKELWRKGSDQVLAGDFGSAISTLEKVQSLEPGHEEVASAISWMREAQDLADSRERLRAATFEYYVAKAKKSVKEAKEAALRPPSDDNEKSAKDDVSAKDGEDQEAASLTGHEEESLPKEDEDSESFKWSRALGYALSAMANSGDEDEFRKEPWLDEIITHTLSEIDRHKSKNEWPDAAALYSYLSSLYPKRKAYEEGFEFCRKRAHLDYVYGPKSNWRSDLRDVSSSVIPQILERMESDYVEEVDFKKACADGLDHLLILGQARSIAKTFPTLSDQDLVNHFTARINGLLKNRVNGRASLAPRHVMEVFRRVVEANNESLRLPESVLVDEFVTGMFEPLDEFTSVIWPAEVEEFNKHTRGEFVGVGIQITQDIGKHIRVESPLEDSPAYRAGIKPGDMITAVDGKSTLDMSINQAVSEITGEPGTKVTLTVKDAVSEEIRDVVLVREQIKLRTVRGHLRDNAKPTGWDYVIDSETNIGYVRVSGFMDKTVEDLDRALKQMRADGVRGLILDLRFNPGGLLTSAKDMCELFIGEGEPIVKTRGRNRQQNMEINSRGRRRFGDLPLIVLVNEYSASASEIVAGAVSGLKEACIVGTRTFGKGSVQNLIPIADNRAYLKLTTAHYYLRDKDRPGDGWYLLHKKPDADTWGVEPDVVVKVIPMENSKIVRLRRERDLLKGRDQASIPKDVLERRPTSEPAEDLPKDEDPDVDPQIAAAVNMMRIKLLSNQPWALTPRQYRAVSRSNDKMKEPLDR
ncbi:MAG TPA: S41 family peptidase [Phycisphaerae bacterium]|nr:S41 family peptidase [Phycisphaerae bacterium]